MLPADLRDATLSGWYGTNASWMLGCLVCLTTGIERRCGIICIGDADLSVFDDHCPRCGFCSFSPVAFTIPRKWAPLCGHDKPIGEGRKLEVCASSKFYFYIPQVDSHNFQTDCFVKLKFGCLIHTHWGWDASTTPTLYYVSCDSQLLRHCILAHKSDSQPRGPPVF